MNAKALGSLSDLKGLNADMAMRARMLQGQLNSRRDLGNIREKLRQLESEQMYLKISIDFIEDIYRKLGKNKFT